MNIWFSSDQHFGHKNIIRLTGRPFADLDEMHRVMKERWNSRIAPHDLVYIVGDISFMQETTTRKLMGELNGRKILIQGNHDKTSRIPKECFEKIVDSDTIEIDGEKVLICHYPYRGTPEELKHAADNGYLIKYVEKRPVDAGGFLIHGHIHEKWLVKRRMINVSVEVWDYYPASLDEIKEIIKKVKDAGIDTLPESSSEPEERGL